MTGNNKLYLVARKLLGVDFMSIWGVFLLARVLFIISTVSRKEKNRCVMFINLRCSDLFPSFSPNLSDSVTNSLFPEDSLTSCLKETFFIFNLCNKRNIIIR